MWVHGEPGAYVVVTLVTLVWKDFIDGASKLNVVGVLGTDARIGLCECGGLGLAVSIFVECVGAVVGEQQRSGQASSIVVQCVDRQSG